MKMASDRSMLMHCMEIVKQNVVNSVNKDFMP